MSYPSYVDAGPQKATYPGYVHIVDTGQIRPPYMGRLQIVDAGKVTVFEAACCRAVVVSLDVHSSSYRYNSPLARHFAAHHW